MNPTLFKNLIPSDIILMVLPTAIRTEPQLTVEYNQQGNSHKMRRFTYVLIQSNKKKTIPYLFLVI